MRSVLSAVCCSVLLAASVPVFAEGTQSSITIEQVSPSQVGVWTLLSPSGESRTSADVGVDQKKYSVSLSEFGPTTLSIAPPAGTSVKISTYRNDGLVNTVDSPQVSFQLYPNERYRFLIQYAFSKLGSLGVTSNPSGVRFRMKGPGVRTYSAKSPYTFQNLPAGRYSIKFAATADCVSPAPVSPVVEADTRNTIHATLSCNAAVSDTGGAVLDIRKSKRSIREEALARELKPRGQRK